MINRLHYISKQIFIIILLYSLITGCKNENDDFQEVVKIALRDVGNKLLLSNNDSTSLILPIKKIRNSKYKLAFNSNLSFEPNTLVSIIEKSFTKTNLPDNYRVEVIKCDDSEVAYSCEISSIYNKSIIPCSGRFLPNKCYTIEVNFIDTPNTLSNQQLFFYAYIIFIVSLLFLYFYKKKQTHDADHVKDDKFVLGSFQFYPEQNKLVKYSKEISLSRKECELLEIFVVSPNQIIKRDELTKRVWEDNGVIVGRSLDTYISKLRKKLQEDDSIKLTNIHGVGYKLEINSQ